jgi:hypothetical protein
LDVLTKAKKQQHESASIVAFVTASRARGLKQTINQRSPVGWRPQDNKAEGTSENAGKALP